LGKIGGKFGYKKKWLNIVKNSVFRVIFVNKKKQNGRVTGNKHIFLGLTLKLTFTEM